MSVNEPKLALKSCTLCIWRLYTKHPVTPGRDEAEREKMREGETFDSLVREEKRFIGASYIDEKEEKIHIFSTEDKKIALFSFLVAVTTLVNAVICAAQG